MNIDNHEHINYTTPIPIKAFIHTVGTGFLHWHEELELLLVLRGSLHITQQNEVRQVSEGQIAIINANDLHSIEQTREHNLTLALQFDTSRNALFNPELGTMHFRITDEANHTSPFHKIRQNMCIIMQEQTRAQDGYIHRIMSCAQDILYILIRYFRQGENQSATQLKPRDRERLARVFSYIQKHYMERLSLQDIANIEELSVNHFSNFFSSKARMRFSDYLNSIRLKAYIEKLLQDPMTSLDEISEQCGFSSPHYASSLFKKYFHTTPGKYRKSIALKQIIIEHSYDNIGYLPQYSVQDMRFLSKYIENASPTRIVRDQSTETYTCNVHESCSQYHRSCLSLITIGRAYEGLLFPLQQALRKAKAEIGFTHVRFHGIFNDEMMILRPDHTGRITYCWHLVDLLIDSLLDIGYKPFLEFTYMPSLLASDSVTIFSWKGNTTPPRDNSLWQDLITHFSQHLLKRYGYEEINKWYFEIWNEPELSGVTWTGSMLEFFKHFDVTVSTLLKTLPNAKVVGPSICGNAKQRNLWCSSFIRFMQTKPWMIYAFSMHCYPERFSEAGISKLSRQTVNKPITFEELDLFPQDYVLEQTQAIRKQIDQTLPIIVTEWNLSQLAFNDICDTAYAATSLIYSALQCDDNNLWLAHWTLSDLMQEHRLPSREFHGGFGLLTVNGIPKMTWWAMWVLSKLYDNIIGRSTKTCITKNGNDYSILVYNHPTLSTAYVPVVAEEREPFCHSAPVRLTIQLTDVVEGEWLLTHYIFDPMQNPKFLSTNLSLTSAISTNDILKLKKYSEPQQRVESIQSKSGALSIDCELKPCGFELLLLDFCP